MSTTSPTKPLQTPLYKEDPPYLSPTYLNPHPGFIDPQRQASRTSAIASLAGGLPVDPEDPAPPKESLRGCAVLAGCVLIAGQSDIGIVVVQLRLMLLPP
jgi:hypothetical protein